MVVSVAKDQLYLHKITLDPGIGLRQVFCLNCLSLVKNQAGGCFQDALWWPDGQAVLLIYLQTSDVDSEDSDWEEIQVSSIVVDMHVMTIDTTIDRMHSSVSNSE